MDNKPIQVFLDKEDAERFNALKKQHVRNTSDLVRWLIRKEYQRLNDASHTAKFHGEGVA